MVCLLLAFNLYSFFIYVMSSHRSFVPDMDNQYGKGALRKMLTQIFGNMPNPLVDGTDQEYSNAIQVIDEHLTEKLADADDANSLELDDLLESYDEDSESEQTKDNFMKRLVSHLNCEMNVIQKHILSYESFSSVVDAWHG